MVAAVLVACAQLLSGCASKPAWSFYDECATRNPAFAQMVACGKASRMAYCQAHNACSADGNALMTYADSLVESVERHEMTEPEAQRKWIEFRTGRIESARQAEATAEAGAAAAAAASRPRTCTTVGGITNCY